MPSNSKKNILPILVFNKMDLLNEEELIETKKIIDYYNKIGYTTLQTSTKLNEIDNLEKLLENKISFFTGQSGVGKSSILNVLDPSLSIKTAEISKALGRGKHTTRHVELLSLGEGYLADTPGFGTVDFTGIDAYTLSQQFREFFEALPNCKYGQCLHINEPNCEVKRRIENNEILKSRYENYLLFVKEIQETKKKY